MGIKQQRLIAIDPGDAHVGIAQGLDLRCYHAFETDPDSAALMLQGWLRTDSVDVVVCESFVLYPWQGGHQHWSDFGTSQLIGVIKWLCETEGAGAPLVMQPASIQKPTEAILRAKKIPLLKAGPHAKSAQLHAYYFMLNGRLRESQNEG